MGKVSKIEYCDSSWSPWIGCTKVSEACTHCYAEAWAKRCGRDFSKVQRASDAAFYAPLKWKDPKRIFVCELSDFMHRKADDWRSMACGVMIAAPWHDYFILSKRPKRYDCWYDDWYQIEACRDWWLGATTENQEQFNDRTDSLLRLPHSKIWVSAEPLLGPIHFGTTLIDTVYGPHISFVVVGAESSPNRRECKVEWIEDIVDQCRAANVPVFVKQGSHRFPGRQGDIPDHLWKIKELPRGEET